MKPFQKVDILGVPYAVLDYDSASEILVENAKINTSYALFALPVHGIIENHLDKEMRGATDSADMIVPDGQPVRWAMNHFYKTGLKDRVYGPILTQWVLKKASNEKLNVFLYGGATENTLDKFSKYIETNYPGVNICGAYREDSPDGDTLTPEMVNAAGSHILLVGRGCPRQEKWIARNHGNINAVMMAVGAAFSFYAGEVSQAPKWMQDRGLEWLYRLSQEPSRLWKRYFVTNGYFILLILKKKIGL